MTDFDVKFSTELKQSKAYLLLVGFLGIYFLLPLTTYQQGVWTSNIWTLQIGVHIACPLLLLLYIRAHSPETWQYIKNCCAVDLKFWAGIFILAFLYWLFLKVVQYLGEEHFPQYFSWPYASGKTTNSAVKSTGNWGWQFCVWIYAVLTAGIVEELAWKLFFLLCLPPKIGLVRYVLAGTIIIMLEHAEQPIGAILLKAPFFAIPTLWYFYKTRKLGVLILFHVFADMFLLAPFIFV